MQEKKTQGQAQTDWEKLVMLVGGGLLLPIILDATAKSFQSCPILCDPIDDSPSGSPVPGIL